MPATLEGGAMVEDWLKLPNGDDAGKMQESEKALVTADNSLSFVPPSTSTVHLLSLYSVLRRTRANSMVLSYSSVSLRPDMKISIVLDGLSIQGSYTHVCSTQGKEGPRIASEADQMPSL